MTRARKSGVVPASQSKFFHRDFWVLGFSAVAVVIVSAGNFFRSLIGEIENDADQILHGGS